MTIIYFILLLTITIFIHELGHFIFAKRAGVHVYEFSIGMGPIIYKFNRKNDETLYAIRLFPIGGFVSMAGEEVNVDEKIDKTKLLFTKSKIQRLLVIGAGVAFNFILAFIIFFSIALFNGSPQNKPVIESLKEDYPIAQTNIKVGSTITHVNGKRIFSVDRLMLELYLNGNDQIEMTTVKDGKEITTRFSGKEIDEAYKYGFGLQNKMEKGIIPSLKFAVEKTYNMLEQMVIVIKSLITGEMKLNSLSGPVGIYGVVDESKEAGIVSYVYLIAIISINIGFINLLPIPAFDGGRLLFLLIETIKGKPIDTKVENIIHSIGFIFLMGLMILVTFNDILKIFS